MFCNRVKVRNSESVSETQCQKYGDLLGWFVAHMQNLEIRHLGILIFPRCTNSFLCFLEFFRLYYDGNPLHGSSSPLPPPVLHAPAPAAPVKRSTTSALHPSAAPAPYLSASFASALSDLSEPSPAAHRYLCLYAASSNDPLPPDPSGSPPALTVSALHSPAVPATVFGDQ